MFKIFHSIRYAPGDGVDANVVDRVRRYIANRCKKSCYQLDLALKAPVRRLASHGGVTQETWLLTSKNLGYDFALCRTSIRPGALDGPVAIYITPRGEERYTFHGASRTLSGAIRKVEKIYNEAARAHLP